MAVLFTERKAGSLVFVCDDSGEEWVRLPLAWADRGPHAASHRLAADGLVALHALVSALAGAPPAVAPPTGRATAWKLRTLHCLRPPRRRGVVGLAEDRTETVMVLANMALAALAGRDGCERPVEEPGRTGSGPP
ncbi:hypothetical protein ACJ6WF_41900 [Streptomyces sp. MMS24-I2-30]|uniref:hypothetical protein n=1 Tax=Streptomyces sp. MMS24-I2-30 TaxID=3351564 RepID=UPI0038969959